MEEEAGESEGQEAEVDIAKETLHTKRLHAVVAELLASGAKRVLDLGCGEGKLLKLMLRQKQFDYMLGVDVSHRSLEIAMRRMGYEEMAPMQKKRVDLVQGALTYRDRRLQGL